MNKMAHYDRIVYEHIEDGFYLVNDEGWTEEEWMTAHYVCVVCHASFVKLTAAGTPISGGAQRYCSFECYTVGRRWRDRERRRAA